MDLFNLVFSFQTLYLLVVGLVATTLLLRGLFIINREKRQRVKSAGKMDFSEAVISPDAAQSTHDHQDDDAVVIERSRALQNIEDRFSFVKRFYIPLVLIISGTLALLPFLPTLPATYLSLVTGVIAGIVGLAARPVIENAIGGVVLTFSQPLRINDTVIIDGQYGTVEKINLLHTVIKVWNWRRLVIPNHKLLQKEIENLTLGEENEWAYVAFYVEPQTDMDLVKSIAKKCMNSKYREKREAPSFWIMELEKDSILCWVAGWAANPAHSWALKSHARKTLIEQLQKNNIRFQMAHSNIQLDQKSASKIEL